MPRADGAQELLVESEYPLAITGGDLALGGGYLYWLEGYAPYRLFRTSTSSIAPELVTEIAADYPHLVADEGAIYWTSGAELQRRAHASTTIDVVATGSCRSPTWP